MGTANYKEIIVNAICDIAPDIEPEEISDQTNIRHDLDIDSVDFLNLVIALNKATGVNIAEADYPKLETLEGAVAFFQKTSP